MTGREQLERRLAALSPEQRRLLEERARRAGLGSVLDVFGEEGTAADAGAEPDRKPVPMEFSLFFFSADGSGEGHDKYRLLLDCARFGDAHGFSAVWTPERHFQDFGGIYPNPSVVGAALAVATEHVQIRAGSTVIPLHHPVRLAEEWAVVDNLSGGRAAVSCASGWHPADFLMAPDHYDERKEIMYRGIEQLRRLWAGESVRFPGPGGDEVEVRTFPRPLQEELPLWVTTSGSRETWTRAGEIGAHVLCTLGNQTLDELRGKIDAYRHARAEHGHDSAAGKVSLMLHTCLGEDDAEVKAQVRGPLADYLETHMKQRDNFVHLDHITEADKRELADMAFQHYFDHASLMGTPRKCSAMVNRLADAGVNDIACLLDFGLASERVLAGLELLDELRARHARSLEEPA